MLIIRGKWRRRLIGSIAASMIFAGAYPIFFRDNSAARFSTASARLEQVAPDLNFNDTPLEEALDFVSARSGARIDVQWGKLRRLGISKDSQVSFQITRARWSGVLRVLIASLGKKDLTYTILDDGKVVVTAQNVLSDLAVERRYDIRHFLRSALSITCSFDDAPSRREADSSAKVQELADAVIRLITDTVDSESWQSNGGSVGRITFDRGWVTVVQTPQAHQEVCRLFEQLLETSGDTSSIWIANRPVRP